MMFRFPWCHGLVLLSLSALAGPTNCLASAKYTFTELGPADGGYLTFNAQGQINPGTISPHQFVHPQSGPYSISSHYSETLPGQIQRGLAITLGQAPVEIQPPPGISGDNQLTAAFAVNASGTYVGVAYSGEHGLFGVAFEYTRAGGSVAVPTPGSVLSAALSINDAGTIVGISDGRAFLSDGKSSSDLNTLIDPSNPFLLLSASDINDLGQIVGYAIDQRDNTFHNYLLTPMPTPTPEPSTILLLGTGCLLYLRKRRRARIAMGA